MLTLISSCMVVIHINKESGRSLEGSFLGETGQRQRRRQETLCFRFPLNVLGEKPDYWKKGRSSYLFHATVRSVFRLDSSSVQRSHPWIESLPLCCSTIPEGVVLTSMVEAHSQAPCQHFSPHRVKEEAEDKQLPFRKAASFQLHPLGGCSKGVSSQEPFALIIKRWE